MNFENNVFLTDIEIVYIVGTIIDQLHENTALYLMNPKLLIEVCEKLLNSSMFMVESHKLDYFDQLKELKQKFNLA